MSDYRRGRVTERALCLSALAPALNLKSTRQLRRATMPTVVSGMRTLCKRRVDDSFLDQSLFLFIHSQTHFGNQPRLFSRFISTMKKLSSLGTFARSLMNQSSGSLDVHTIQQLGVYRTQSKALSNTFSSNCLVSGRPETEMCKNFFVTIGYGSSGASAFEEISGGGLSGSSIAGPGGG